jgi:hypothetical protein
MAVTIEVTMEMTLTSDPGDEALDVWLWTVQGQLEDLALVEAARVTDAKRVGLSEGRG